MMMQTKKVSGVDTLRWQIVAERVTHPGDVPGVGAGVLVRNRRSGAYGILQCGVVRSVPARWAAYLAVASSVVLALAAVVE
jgi:hypothetical protein